MRTRLRHPFVLRLLKGGRRMPAGVGNLRRRFVGLNANRHRQEGS